MVLYLEPVLLINPPHPYNKNTLVIQNRIKLSGIPLYMSVCESEDGGHDGDSAQM